MTEIDQNLPESAAMPASSWGTELRATLALAWPLVVSQIAQMAIVTTDVVMMGWLGAEALAAGTLATSFMVPFLLFGVGATTAVAPLVAQALGSGDHRSVRRSTRQGFWVSIVIAAVLIPFVWQIEHILLALGQDPEIVPQSGIYIRFAVWMVLPALMINVLRAFLSAHSNTTIILWITCAGIAINAFTNYGLMFGNFGLPRMELAGAGLSSTLVNFLMLGLTLLYVLTHKRYRRYALMIRFWRPDWQKFFEIFRIGVPIGLMILAEVGLFSIAALLMGLLSTEELAGHAVAGQCAAIAFMVPLGVGQATTVRVGLAAGRRHVEGVKLAGWTGMAIGTGFMALSCLAFLLVPAVFVRFYLDPGNPANQAAFGFAVTYLGVAGVFQTVDGLQACAAAALRGLSDTRIPMIIAIVGYWLVGMPVAWFLCFVLEWRGVGLWFGLAAGLAVAAVALTWRFAWRERLNLVRFAPSS
ncbi:MATE family efflux transporter [Cucumibacter marinus]|uniref:MATE family efflux transporter n=1 Tax=Cucumibacter marinus TaxID=1121252 RepID=UPI0003FDDC9C|nr:MATE family efflux transporter [Cucumibacter marinus]